MAFFTSDISSSLPLKDLAEHSQLPGWPFQATLKLLKPTIDKTKQCEAMPAPAYSCSFLPATHASAPPYQFLPTPDFLIASLETEDHYSDTSSITAEDASPTAGERVLPWASQASQIRPLMDRMLNDQIKEIHTARLRWRQATKPETASSVSIDTRSDAAADNRQTQAAIFHVSCLCMTDGFSATLGNKHYKSNALERSQSTTSLDLSLPPTWPNINASDRAEIWEIENIREEDKEYEVRRWLDTVPIAS